MNSLEVIGIILLDILFFGSLLKTALKWKKRKENFGELNLGEYKR